jgi:hypothetical protein
MNINRELLQFYIYKKIINRKEALKILEEGLKAYPGRTI